MFQLEPQQQQQRNDLVQTNCPLERQSVLKQDDPLNDEHWDKHVGRKRIHGSVHIPYTHKTSDHLSIQCFKVSIFLNIDLM